MQQLVYKEKSLEIRLFSETVSLNDLQAVLIQHRSTIFCEIIWNHFSFEINETLFTLYNSIADLSFLIYDLIQWKKYSKVGFIKFVTAEAVIKAISMTIYLKLNWINCSSHKRKKKTFVFSYSRVCYFLKKIYHTYWKLCILYSQIGPSFMPCSHGAQNSYFVVQSQLWVKFCVPAYKNFKSKWKIFMLIHFQ